MTYLTYAVHAGQGPRDGFCMVMVCQVFLSAASLDASFSLGMDLALQSFEMQSSHLLGGTASGLISCDLSFHGNFGVSCGFHS